MGSHSNKGLDGGVRKLVALWAEVSEVFDQWHRKILKKTGGGQVVVVADFKVSGDEGWVYVETVISCMLAAMAS